jgi:hypothetical protein
MAFGPSVRQKRKEPSYRAKKNAKHKTEDAIFPRASNGTTDKSANEHRQGKKWHKLLTQFNPHPPLPSTPFSGRRGLWKRFSVTVGTVMEASHIPITKWVMAMAMLCASKKSISAHQLHRMLKITYKSAWFLAHRIRYAMGPNNANAAKLKGIVEVDEPFVGGRDEQRTTVLRQTPVVALIERDGQNAHAGHFKRDTEEPPRRNRPVR